MGTLCVVPAESDPELPTFGTEDEAWAEVARCNERLARAGTGMVDKYIKPDRYWIAVEMPSGQWTVAETTAPLTTKRDRFLGALGEILNPFNGPPA